mgnify:CR=1 FL=1
MADSIAATVVRDAVARMPRYRQRIREALKRTPPLTLVRVTDEEFRAFVELKVQEFPPRNWALPDGQVVWASVWTLVLPFVEGGDKVLARYDRITKGER